MTDPTKASTLARDDARGYTDADLAEVSDNPDWTDAELGGARPFAELFPEAAASIKKGRGKQKMPTKVSVTLRLDPKIVDHFKSTGKGWQIRINDALRKVAGS